MIETWNTNKKYSEHGQRIAATLLPNDKVLFVDTDRGISGVTNDPYPHGDYSLRQHVMTQYDYNEYSESLLQAAELDRESIDRLQKSLKIIAETQQLTQTVTDTRNRWIPTSMLDVFRGRVDELNKKAAKLKCEPISYVITDEKDTIKVPAEQTTYSYKPGYSYEVTRVEITGQSPKIQGYSLIAKIEHDSELKANLVHVFGENKLDTQKLIHQDCLCDHCGIKRQRNNTYILKNDETGDLSQIGSSCLKDFTGHSNPENACYIREYIEEVFEEMDDFYKLNSPKYLHTEDYLAIVIECSEKYGFVSALKAEEKMIMSTGSIAIEIYTSKDEHLKPEKERFKVSDKSIEQAKVVKNYIANMDRNTSGSYINNIITLMQSDMVKIKNFNMVASALPIYLKELEKQNSLVKDENAPPKQYLGKIGDKITFNAKLVGYGTTDSGYGVVHIYKFNDENQNNITWFASSRPNTEINDELDYKITATVKTFKEFRNEPQTIITRPTIEILNLVNEQTIHNAKELATQLGNHKGKDVITAFSEHYERNQDKPETWNKYIEGIGFIHTFITNFPETDKIRKTIENMNTHQILTLSSSLQKAGCYAGQLDKRVFTKNVEMMNAVTNLYPPEAKKSKKR